MDFATRAKNAHFLHDGSGRLMIWRQFRRWADTRQSVRETRDVLRRRRLGWRP